MLIAEPTAEDTKKGSRKVTAIIVALVAHLVLIILFVLIAVIPAYKDEPEIVAKIVSASQSSQPRMEKKAVMKQIEQASTSSAASPIAKMLRANVTAQIAAPEVTKVSEGPLGLGEGDFGSGFGSGSGMGSGASFFGSKSNGSRFLFVLDHSTSMKDSQVAIRDKELENAIGALPPGVQYQVILFAGGCLFAKKGWSVSDYGPAREYKILGPRGKKYPFRSVRGASDWEFEGDDTAMPREKWLQATPSNVKKTMDFIKREERFYGTDWGLALKMAHLMEPRPDVIFFMSDGTGGNEPEPILEFNKAHGKPRINTFAMQTKAGARQFNEIAEGTRGEFVIVIRGGKTIKGKEFLKNPAKYMGQLR